MNANDSKYASESTPTASDESGKRVTSERRKFILTHLAAHRRLYLRSGRDQRVHFLRHDKNSDTPENRTVIAKYANTANASIVEDLKAFNNLGIAVQLIDDPRSDDRVLVDGTAKYSDTAMYREFLRRKEKTALAAACLGLVCGIPSTPQSILKRRQELINDSSAKNPLSDFDSSKEIDDYDLLKFFRGERLQEEIRQNEMAEKYLSRLLGSSDQQMPPTISEIGNALVAWNHGDIALKAKGVFFKLQSFWHKMNRSIALDAGTTNDVLARRLAKLELPMQLGHLARLNVCTNSSHIFQLIGAAHVDAKAMIVGGEQLGRSEAIAGQMAELFLKSNPQLQFGLTIVGAGGIDVENMAAYVDDYLISNIKASFLEKSNIRVIVVDNGKLKPPSGSPYYGFVKLDPSYVDLIVVNEPLPASELDTRGDNALHQHQFEKEEFYRNIEKLTRNVPILVAKYGRSNERCLAFPN